MKERPKLNRVEQEERAKVREGMYQPRDRRRDRLNIYILLGLLGLLIIAGIFFYGKLAQKNVPDEIGTAVATPVVSAAQADTASPGSAATSAASVAPTAAADLAADFTVTNAAGEKVSLSDNFGKPIVLNFWATWCSPCKQELPYFDAASKEYGDSITFMMVNITDGSRDTREGVEKFVADAGYTFPLYYDLELDAADAYAIRSIPTTVLIDASGAIVDTHTGILSEAQVQSIVDTLLGE